jgi:hypothetical protein
MESTVSATQVDGITRLTVLAAQYGPFLFAVLFIVLVPVIGEKWFSKILQTKLVGGPKEREATVQVYKFYWVSGVVFGLFLAALSVAWWMYVQTQYVLPRSEEDFNKRVSAEFSKRVFEGVIGGADDNDIFVSDGSGNRQYNVYIHPIRNEIPMRLRFAVLFSEGAKANDPIQIGYMNKETYDKLQKSGKGYIPAKLTFCLSKDGTTLTLVKEEGQDPRLNQNCEGSKK